MTAQTQSPLLSPDQQHILGAVLDEIVPPSDDGRLPGAGELGLVSYLEEVVTKDPGLGTVIVQGVEAIAAHTRAQGLAEFPVLDRAQRLEILNALDSTAPAFVPSLIYNTFVGYYQNPRISAALGIGADPPHPRGYAMEPNNLALLDPVRGRGKKLYRDVPDS